MENQTVSLSGTGLGEEDVACVEKTGTLLKPFPLKKKKRKKKTRRKEGRRERGKEERNER